MKFKLLTLLSFITLTLQAQTPAIKWQATYGGTSTDNLSGMVPTPDGGCIAAGGSTSTDGYVTGNHGNQDVWVTKIDQFGGLQWEKSYGGSMSDACFEISATSDGGFVIAGRSASSDGDVALNQGSDDYWIFKIDASGNLLWEKTYGGSQSEMARSCVQAPDGKYYVMGSTYSNDGDVTGNHGSGDYWVLKLDSAGNLLWQKTLGGSAAELGWRVQPTSDGGALAIGSAASSDGNVISVNHGSTDIWVVKLDSVGIIQWEKCYGGTAGDDGNSIALTGDGGFIASGYSSSSDGDVTVNYGSQDVWMFKADSLGNIQWQKSFGGSGQDWGIDSRLALNGEYLMSGRTASSDYDVASNHGGIDAWAVRLDTAANIIWEKTFGGTAHDEGKDFIETSNGEYLFSAFTTSDDGDVIGNNGSYDYWILRLTKDYNVISGKTYVDFNSNQVFDGSDIPLINHKITETSTGRLCFSDSTGDYNLTVTDTGTFTLVSDSLTYFISQPLNHVVTFSTFSQVDSLNDFAHAPTASVNDLSVALTPYSLFRPGRKAYYAIHYSNIGTTFINGTIMLFPDTILSYDSSSVAPTTITTDTITWSTGLLAPFQSGYIEVRMMVDSMASIDSSLVTSVMIDPVAGDSDITNNFDDWQSTITASFDPNYKEVSDDELTVTQLTNAPYLEYIINFQNTGNDTAFVVNVHDTIPAELDMNSFKLISSSHNVSLNYENSTRNMIFGFNNILLPDSTTSEKESHGFVHYRIKPLSSLVAGNTISNTAFIYFDFNTPVATNTAITTIINPTGIEEVGNDKVLHVYPNPSGNFLMIQLKSTEEFDVTVTDITGRVIFRQQEFKNPALINTSTWKPGMYFINALNGKQSYNGKVIKN